MPMIRYFQHFCTLFKSLLLVIGLSFLSVSSLSANDEEITIKQEDDATYYEHRVNGVLVEIKVEPKIGPAYYLVPDDGGGWIRADQSQILVPKWKLFEW